MGRAIGRASPPPPSAYPMICMWQCPRGVGTDGTSCRRVYGTDELPLTWRSIRRWTPWPPRRRTPRRG